MFAGWLLIALGVAALVVSAWSMTRLSAGSRITWSHPRSSGLPRVLLTVATLFFVFGAVVMSNERVSGGVTLGAIGLIVVGIVLCYVPIWLHNRAL